jgi:prophage DNA circulation protein
MPDLLATVLLEASYEGVAFPTSDVEGEFGHDAVEHTAYLRPGAAA